MLAFFKHLYLQKNLPLQYCFFSNVFPSPFWEAGGAQTPFSTYQPNPAPKYRSACVNFNSYLTQE